jgi:hypothetical protein
MNRVHLLNNTAENHSIKPVKLEVAELLVLIEIPCFLDLLPVKSINEEYLLTKEEQCAN